MRRSRLSVAASAPVVVALGLSVFAATASAGFSGIFVLPGTHGFKLGGLTLKGEELDFDFDLAERTQIRCDPAAASR
jgi:hypothetical protein